MKESGLEQLSLRLASLRFVKFFMIEDLFSNSEIFLPGLSSREDFIKELLTELSIFMCSGVG